MPIDIFMNEKQLMRAAKTFSTLFSPFYAPLWAFAGLFVFSYLKLLPSGYKLIIFLMVYCFTVFIPRMSINIFRKINKWTHWQLSHRQHRHTPYVLTLVSYTVCLFLMTRLNTAMFIRGIVMAALIAQIICVIINRWWKISTHMVGMGGLTGTIIAFSYLFYFNPVYHLCSLILLSGIVGTSRIVLRQHSLAQVLTGFVIGFICAMFFLLISWM